MTTSENSKKRLVTFLAAAGFLMALLHVTATEAALTVYNPARLPLEINVDNQTVNVETDVVSLDITQAEQKLNVSIPQGGSVSVNARDEEVIVILPEPLVGFGGEIPPVQVVQLPSLMFPAVAGVVSGYVNAAVPPIPAEPLGTLP